MPKEKENWPRGRLASLSGGVRRVNMDSEEYYERMKAYGFCWV
jgi:hypothetical protein